jgi:hypothetical protein
MALLLREEDGSEAIVAGEAARAGEVSEPSV